MIIKLAYIDGLRAFLHSTSGKRTAIGAAIGGLAGAIHRKDNRTHGAAVGATLGGLAGFAAHETGFTDLVKKKMADGVTNIKEFGTKVKRGTF